MAEKRSAFSDYYQRLSKRERFIASLTLMALLSALIYQFPYTMQVKAVNSLRTGMASAEKELLDLTAQVADLKGRMAENRGLSAGWQLADRKNAVLFLEDVSGEARRLGVNLVAVHPSKEIDKDSYKEVSMNLDLRGRYRELAEYFKRLEDLPRVVNLRKIRIESCPDSASVCAVQVEAVTYMTK